MLKIEETKQFDEFNELFRHIRMTLMTLMTKPQNIPVTALQKSVEKAVYEQVDQFNLLFKLKEGGYKLINFNDDVNNRFCNRLYEIFNMVGKVNILLEKKFPHKFELRIKPVIKNVKFIYGLMSDDNGANFKYWKFHNVSFGSMSYYDFSFHQDKNIDKPKQWEHAELSKCNFLKTSYKLRGLGAADLFKDCQLDNFDRDPDWAPEFGYGFPPYMDDPFKGSEITQDDQLKIIKLYHHRDWVKPEFDKTKNSIWKQPVAVTLSTDLTFSKSKFDDKGREELEKLLKNTQEPQANNGLSPKI